MSCAPTKTSVGEIIGKNPGSHKSYAILRITRPIFWNRQLPLCFI